MRLQDIDDYEMPPKPFLVQGVDCGYSCKGLVYSEVLPYLIFGTVYQLSAKIAWSILLQNRRLLLPDTKTLNLCTQLLCY